jgi:tagatose-6-phosphate ketose/aldose isomerase
LPQSLAELLARSAQDQQADGYLYTVREIDQQPDTWIDTARSVGRARDELHAHVSAAGVLGARAASAAIVLTGSGSSLYVGELVARPIQRVLQVPVCAVPSGEILTHLDSWILEDRDGLVVSFARSGDSPESAAAVEEILAARPRCHHLIITCNPSGRLARAHASQPGVRALVLDNRTCDRSLVMTSSFTNMAVAASSLAALDRIDRYQTQVEQLAATARATLGRSQTLAAVAQAPFESAVFLGSGSAFGAARESALKMLEMTDGHVRAFPESYLGVRHGPMSAIHDDTLVVCFLASDPTTRAYELDLIRELQRKGLGRRLIVGEDAPAGIAGTGDEVLECAGLAAVGDDLAAIGHVVVGQLLALFRCLALGLQPDSPSRTHVINRVVEDFTIHRRQAPPER